MNKQYDKEKYRNVYGDEATDSRQMPSSPEAEQVILAAVMNDPESVNKAVLALKPDCFYITKHKQIFECMLELANLSESQESVKILELMRDKGFSEGDTDKAYIENLRYRYTGIENVDYYINIIVEKYSLREVIEVCRKTCDMCFDGSELSEVLDLSESLIYNIKNGRHNDRMKTIRDSVKQVMDDLNAVRHDTTGQFQNVKCGISDLDRALGGFAKSDLVLLAARPGVGKTALALNIAYGIASSKNYDPQKTVVVFSLEMSSEQLAKRIISANLRIDNVKLRDGTLSDEEWLSIYGYWHSELLHVALKVDDTPNITVLDMKSKLRKEKNIGLVVIDYLQLMNSSKKTDNRVQEISDITRSLKLMAKEFNVPILLLSQLSRSIEQRNKNDRQPKLSDLRDSGSIEQDADIVFFLSHPEGYAENPALQNVIIVNVEKNRHGQTAELKLNWDGAHTAFKSYDHSYDIQPEAANEKK